MYSLSERSKNNLVGSPTETCICDSEVNYCLSTIKPENDNYLPSEYPEE